MASESLTKVHGSTGQQIKHDAAANAPESDNAVLAPEFIGNDAGLEVNVFFGRRMLSLSNIVGGAMASETGLFR